MTHFRKSKLLILMIMLLAVVQSCAKMKSWMPPNSLNKTSDHATDTSQPSVHASAQDADPPEKHSVKTSARAVNLAKKHMETGEYQEAIDAYNAEYRKHPHDQALQEAYLKSIEDIISAADRASDKVDYASAGRNYDVLLKNYAYFKEFEKKLSFNSNDLNEKLSFCKQAIFKQGFQEYRKGNLSGAIVLWQDLLAIDPENKDIKKALRTAKLQQKNLKE